MQSLCWGRLRPECTVDQHNNRPSLAEGVIRQLDPISGGDELSVCHFPGAAGGVRCVLPPLKMLSRSQRSVCQQKIKDVESGHMDMRCLDCAGQLEGGAVLHMHVCAMTPVMPSEGVTSPHLKQCQELTW